MNLKDPNPCCFQHCCVNYTPAENGNCGCEFDDVLECWVESNEQPSIVTEKKGGRDCGQTSATGQAIPDVECVNSTSATTPDSMNCVEKEKGEQK